MMMLNTKLGVAVLAFFSTSGSAVAAAGDDSNSKNQLGRKRRTTTKTNLRKGNRNNLATKRQDKHVDITEDVAFWTRELQAGSMPPVTRPTRAPTPRPTRRPTSNPTPNPTGVVVTPFPTEDPVSTPNPTDAVSTPNPTDPIVTPNPTATPQTPEPTPAPVVTTPAPSVTPPAEGPVARDDDGVMNADDGIAFFSVLENDTPAPGETLFVQSVGDGTDGLCTIGLDLLQVTFIPDVGFDGTDTCDYVACDALNACDSATLTVVVEPPLSVAMWLSMPVP